MEKKCQWPRKKIISRHSKKKKIDTEDLIRKIKRLLVLAVILAVLYEIFVSDMLEIKNIKLAGNSKVKSEEIEKFIFDNIRRSRFYSEIKGDMALISTDVIASSVLDNFKELRRVVVVKKIPNTIEVSVEEKNISAVWCRVSCFWLDEEGVVFKPLAEGQVKDKDSENIIMVLDDENSPMKTGDKITDKNFLDFARTLKHALKDEAGIDFDNIKTPGVVTDEIWVQTRRNWRIFFNVRGNAEEEVMLLKQIMKEKLTEEEIKNLEYIDLRIKGKIFYKIRI